MLIIDQSVLNDVWVFFRLAESRVRHADIDHSITGDIVDIELLDRVVRADAQRGAAYNFSGDAWKLRFGDGQYEFQGDYESMLRDYVLVRLVG